MAVTAGNPLPVDFTPSGRHAPDEDEHGSRNDAFHALTAEGGTVAPTTSASSPAVVQVRRGGPRGGGSGRDRGNGKGDDRGDDRKPENGDSNDRPRDRDNRRNGNRYDLDLELEGGQGRQQDEQGRSASNGFPLRWENPLNLVHQLVDLFTKEKSPQRPAYGMTVGARKARSARR
ncbi:hypothetical protein FOF52_14595 [Thermobifida alba]|uniref:Uncharacterized protein n=1 Tax=Thermobifida alba TaxID=53522 RepID=A0ABY4L6P4_THEAE|nr:hypothetical protein [Thermobifida alba]UPT22040.1 hypothetical protein FOF52_14595 [Thermobifida alba]HLU95383.1 hypothetical protein [Thermobifida alba]